MGQRPLGAMSLDERILIETRAYRGKYGLICSLKKV